VDSDLTGFFTKYRHDRAVQTTLADILTRQEAIVAAVDDVNAAVAALTTQVNDAVTAIGGQGLTTQEAETFVGDLNNLAQQISAALNPPPA
jgi:hypothetical protein